MRGPGIQLEYTTMVVKNNTIAAGQLDLAYLALFVGQRVNELVVSRMKKGGFGSVRESHGYVIQHLIERERSITELARRMEVTQQAASKSVAELIEFGVLEAAEGADKRTKVIRLSKRGWKSVKTSRREREQIDGMLEKAIGKKSYGRVKDGLLACLKELGGAARVRSRRIREPK
jgi:DNA-binding MarR family transcriptional regulator